jgi:hypothetical protein
MPPATTMTAAAMISRVLRDKAMRGAAFQNAMARF